MSKRNINNNIQQALKQFFGEKVNIYEAGSENKRPKNFQDRPFFNLLSNNNTYFIESLNKETKSDGSYAVTTDGPLKDGSLDTSFSKFLKKMEERFNKVKPNHKLFVIDADAIRNRYALDEAPDRNLAKSLFEYIKEKKEKYDIEKNFPAKEDDIDILINDAFINSIPSSLSQTRNVTKNNLNGDSYVSLVIADNVDKLSDTMFSENNKSQRMKKFGFTNNILQRFTLYHEFGHSLDPDFSIFSGVPNLISDVAANSFAHYKTECFADVHAVLQLARDEKNTNMGEFIADLRIADNLDLINLNGKKGIKESKPDIEKKLEKMQQELYKTPNPNGKKFVNLGKNSEIYKQYSIIGRAIAYYTTPVVDSAVKFAKKGLKDGSLLKMTDTEVLKTVEKLVKQRSLSIEKFSDLCTAIIKGDEKNSDIKNIRKRGSIANQNMFLSKEEYELNIRSFKEEIKLTRENQLKSALGIPSETEETVNITNTEENINITNTTLEKKISAWNNRLIEKIEKNGFTKESLLKTVKNEKNKIRKHHGQTPNEFGEIKLQILNDTFLKNPDFYLAKARTRKTVRETISAVKTVSSSEDKVKNKGINIIDDFLNFKTASANYAENSVNNVTKTDSSNIALENVLKARNQELINYNKTMIAEKSAQNLAFKICKNKKVLDDIKKTDPNISKMIENSAKKRHPVWLDEYHSIFISNDKSQLKKTLTSIKNYSEMINKERNGFTDKLKTQLPKNFLDKHER